MSLALLHVLVMGFVLVLVVVLPTSPESWLWSVPRLRGRLERSALQSLGFVGQAVLESLPAECWTNRVSECCVLSVLDPPGDAFNAYPMSLLLLHILRTVPTPRRPSGVVRRAVRRVLPLRNRILTVPEPRPTKFEAIQELVPTALIYANPNLRFDPSIRYG